MTSKGATIDVGAWLRDLGLGQYEATFRENAINEKVLPNLTAEDLKDMGNWHRWAPPNAARRHRRLARWHRRKGTDAIMERWSEAEINRMAGEIALKSPGPDATKTQAYFERALTVARAQQAKSWELRAAMSMARLWRDQGKRKETRELLAQVCG